LSGPFLLAGNFRSRSGRELLGKVRNALEELGAVTEVAVSRRPEELRRAVRTALTKGTRRVIAVGGDGTVGLVAGALVGRDATLGIVPAGTGNDFARTMGIPMNTAEAARIAVRGSERAVDVGLVNGHPFVNAASVGLSAEVAHNVTAAQKAMLGPLAYPATAARLLVSHRPLCVRLSGDAAFEGWSHQLVVANGHFQGGGTPTLPEADPESGRLAAYLVEGRSRVTLFLVGLLVRFGRHTELAPTVTFEGRRFLVETERPRRINADGEEIGRTPAEFSIRPRALRVLVPADGLTPSPPAGVREGSPLAALPRRPRP